ncbi:DUF6286 domain-containing protein [Streptomyces roseus]|uniref:DUF6286 domain-containing protein n=1 Tax=Streptomyces roseus TaxID=66430 RepID=UPI0033D9D4B8
MTAPAPAGRAPAAGPGDAPAPARIARFRSARRIPAALTALAVLGVAGLFLYDLIAVRAGRPGMQWRRELADQLGQKTPADPWVLVAAGVLAVAGALLLFLALTPGLRRILSMRPPEPEAGVRAGLERKAAALVLRDRAMEVSGVQSARVAVRRSRVKVRAQSHFRELDEVRADLEEVLTVGIAELGLAHPPQPRVRVTRAPAGKR